MPPSLVSTFEITTSYDMVTRAIHFSIPIPRGRRFFAGRKSRSNNASLIAFDTFRDHNLHPIWSLLRCWLLVIERKVSQSECGFSRNKDFEKDTMPM